MLEAHFPAAAAGVSHRYSHTDSAGWMQFVSAAQNATGSPSAHTHGVASLQVAVIIDATLPGAEDI